MEEEYNIIMCDGEEDVTDHELEKLKDTVEVLLTRVSLLENKIESNDMDTKYLMSKMNIITSNFNIVKEKLYYISNELRDFKSKMIRYAVVNTAYNSGGDGFYLSKLPSFCKNRFETLGLCGLLGYDTYNSKRFDHTTIPDEFNDVDDFEMVLSKNIQNNNRSNLGRTNSSTEYPLLDNTEALLRTYLNDKII